MTPYRKRIEQRITHFVMQGLQDKEIATEMHLSKSAVKRYLSEIYQRKGWYGFGSRIKLALENAK